MFCGPDREKTALFVAVDTRASAEFDSKDTKRVKGPTNQVSPSRSLRMQRFAANMGRTLMLAALFGFLLHPLATSFAAPLPKAAQAANSKAERDADAQQDKKGPETVAPDNGWSANRNGPKITLRGAAPSEEDRQTTLGMVKAHFPDLTIEDKLAILPSDQPREQWLAAVSFGLQRLSQLYRGKVRLEDGTLTVSGQAVNAEEYGNIKKALAGTLPAGLTLGGGSVRPPVADPFIFQADLGPNALSLAGSVPSEGSRKSVRDLSRQLFARPGLDDRLEVASGAPENWDEAVAAALRALSRLEIGKVALSGVAVSIEGIAPDQGTAVAVSSQLRRDLPERFSTSESIKWKEAASQLDLGAEPGPAQDVAATIIPRIKALPEDDTRWRSGSLPPLAPFSVRH